LSHALSMIILEVWSRSSPKPAWTSSFYFRLHTIVGMTGIGYPALFFNVEMGFCKLFCLGLA
jgi:hypothetical protein